VILALKMRFVRREVVSMAVLAWMDKIMKSLVSSLTVVAFN